MYNFRHKKKVTLVNILNKDYNPYQAYVTSKSYLIGNGIDIDYTCEVIKIETGSGVNIWKYDKRIFELMDLELILRLFDNFDKKLLLKGMTLTNDMMKVLFRAEHLSKKDIVCFTAFEYTLFLELLMAAAIKRRNKNVKIVFGGPAIMISENTRKILQKCNFIDHIINGDLETGLYDLLTRDIDKYHISHNNNLDRLYIPIYSDKEIYLSDNEVFLYTSRNCPNSCKYCVNFGNLPFRKISLDIVSQWIEYYQLKENVKSIYFTDANINFSPDRFSQILDFILRSNKKYYFWANPSNITEEHLNKMKFIDMGEYEGIWLGLDLLSDNSQTKLNRLGINNIYNVLDWNEKNKTSIRVPVMLGSPTNDIDSFEFIKEVIIKYKESTFLIFPFLLHGGSYIHKNPKEFDIEYTYHNEETANIYKPLYDDVVNIPKYYKSQEDYSELKVLVEKVKQLDLLNVRI